MNKASFPQLLNTEFRVLNSQFAKRFSNHKLLLDFERRLNEKPFLVIKEKEEKNQEEEEEEY